MLEILYAVLFSVAILILVTILVSMLFGDFNIIANIKIAWKFTKELCYAIWHMGE